ncbi:hypothetical protein Arad_3627 [Rhizobium rhizogenes K84]|uniref:Uncharacterized protein n=1 Tax=Rhizobium rhizogenes (strain K84 / ATCC BAA-868) TaxID=311403 RepID=B9J9D1_RHIR8|nr:hypothetical protein Arad_3627 [Rhizobium rhizogenes K84]
MERPPFAVVSQSPDAASRLRWPGLRHRLSGSKSSGDGKAPRCNASAPATATSRWSSACESSSGPMG